MRASLAPTFSISLLLDPREATRKRGRKKGSGEERKRRGKGRREKTNEINSKYLILLPPLFRLEGQREGGGKSRERTKKKKRPSGLKEYKRKMPPALRKGERLKRFFFFLIKRGEILAGKGEAICNFFSLEVRLARGGKKGGNTRKKEASGSVRSSLLISPSCPIIFTPTGRRGKGGGRRRLRKGKKKEGGMVGSIFYLSSIYPPPAMGLGRKERK